MYFPLQTVPVELSSALNSLLKSEKNVHSILNIESHLIASSAHLSSDKYFVYIWQELVSVLDLLCNYLMVDAFKAEISFSLHSFLWLSFRSFQSSFISDFNVV